MAVKEERFYDVAITFDGPQGHGYKAHITEEASDIVEAQIKALRRKGFPNAIVRNAELVTDEEKG